MTIISLIDLRYLVAAEVFDLGGSPMMTPCLALARSLKSGAQPQRLSTLLRHAREDRDTAFGRLLALHQTFEAHVHAPTEDDE